MIVGLQSDGIGASFSDDVDLATLGSGRHMYAVEVPSSCLASASEGHIALLVCLGAVQRDATVLR